VVTALKLYEDCDREIWDPQLEYPLLQIFPNFPVSSISVSCLMWYFLCFREITAGRPPIVQMWYLHPWEVLQQEESILFWMRPVYMLCSEMLNLVRASTLTTHESVIWKNTQYMFHFLLLGSVHQVKFTLGYRLPVWVSLSLLFEGKLSHLLNKAISMHTTLAEGTICAILF